MRFPKIGSRKGPEMTRIDPRIDPQIDPQIDLQTGPEMALRSLISLTSDVPRLE